MSCVLLTTDIKSLKMLGYQHIYFEFIFIVDFFHFLFFNHWIFLFLCKLNKIIFGYFYFNYLGLSGGFDLGPNKTKQPVENFTIDRDVE